MNQSHTGEMRYGLFLHRLSIFTGKCDFPFGNLDTKASCLFCGFVWLLLGSGA